MSKAGEAKDLLLHGDEETEYIDFALGKTEAHLTAGDDSITLTERFGTEVIRAIKKTPGHGIGDYCQYLPVINRGDSLIEVAAVGEEGPFEDSEMEWMFRVRKVPIEKDKLTPYEKLIMDLQPCDWKWMSMMELIWFGFEDKPITPKNFRSSLKKYSDKHNDRVKGFERALKKVKWTEKEMVQAIEATRQQKQTELRKAEKKAGIKRPAKRRK